MNSISKTKTIWNNLAAWWDEVAQDGDLYHRTFLFPTITKWVDPKKGMRILDMGCGNGALARLFAKPGELPKDYLWAQLSDIPPAVICRFRL